MEIEAGSCNDTLSNGRETIDPRGSSACRRSAGYAGVNGCFGSKRHQMSSDKIRRQPPQFAWVHPHELRKGAASCASAVLRSPAACVNQVAGSDLVSRFQLASSVRGSRPTFATIGLPVSTAVRPDAACSAENQKLLSSSEPCSTVQSQMRRFAANRRACCDFGRHWNWKAVVGREFAKPQQFGAEDVNRPA